MSGQWRVLLREPCGCREQDVNGHVGRGDSSRLHGTMCRHLLEELTHFGVCAGPVWCAQLTIWTFARRNRITKGDRSVWCVGSSWARLRPCGLARLSKARPKQLALAADCLRPMVSLRRPPRSRSPSENQYHAGTRHRRTSPRLPHDGTNAAYGARMAARSIFVWFAAEQSHSGPKLASEQWFLRGTISCQQCSRYRF